MAAYTFINQTANAVGTTPVDVYTVPATQKSIVIGCMVTNTTGATLPAEVKLVKAYNTEIHLSVSERIKGGTTTDFLQGKKLVMTAGEKINITSKAASSFDCVLSILEDVD